MIIVLYCCCCSNIKADDNVIKVQTLTFDSILTRGGTWKFPNTNDTYRKILMYYTLKCDPKTLWDQYNCGEWDYLTYSTVTHYTGKMDSTALSYPEYKLGRLSSDTLAYNTKDILPMTIKQRIVQSAQLTTTSAETDYNIGSAQINFSIKNEPFKMQFIVTKDELKDFGVVKGKYGKIKFNVISGVGTVKNLRIRYKLSANKSISSFTDTDMNLIFEGDQSFAPGIVELPLISDIQTNSLSGILIEISSEGVNGENIVIGGFSNPNTIVAAEIEKYFKFDNNTDYITYKADLFKEAGKFTFEGKFMVNNWQAWANLFGCGDKTLLQLGDKAGDLYCIIRDPVNSYGKVSGIIEMNKWYHFAMVYDGSQTENKNKLKLYINGESVSLQYTGYIPERTSKAENQYFTISTNPDNGNCLNGGASEVRVWKEALTQDDIKAWMFKRLNDNHPMYDNLVLYYPCDSINELTVKDMGKNKMDGTAYGAPEQATFSAAEMINCTAIPYSPCLSFVQSDYTRSINETIVETSEKASKVMLSKFEIVNKQPVMQSYSWVYPTGTFYKYNPSGTIIDSTIISSTDTVFNKKLNYFSEPSPQKSEIEIGRFITPYGKGLDLGPDGFTWVYDVTDFVDILKGDVTFNAGNFQELIDVRFDFYKGVPPRNVVNLNEVWGQYNSYTYKDMADYKALPFKNVKLNENTKQAKMKTRLTGHGHYPDVNNPPHCCEWKNNTHYLSMGNTDKELISWHIWQDECSMNPVYPQGGTWPGSREGWCPGDLVKENEFELTQFIKNDNSLDLEYGITEVPTNKLGMGNGNYIVSMQLIEYGQQNKEVDAEVYDVFAPNNFRLYSRKNPLCNGPIIVIRNNGIDTLKTLKFNYGVSGGQDENYEWSGAIAPNLRDTISLPISGSHFWTGDIYKKFRVSISEPNGRNDQYTDNDTMSTNFNRPDVYPKNVTLKLKTHNYGNYLHLIIKDITGKIVLDRNNLYSNSVTTDKFNFPDGCYTLELVDDEGYGLDYWAVREQLGTGYMQILDLNGNIIKTFEPDFGLKISYSFSLGDDQYVEDRQEQFLINLFPNPAVSKVQFSMNMDMPASVCELYDATGKIIKSMNLDIIDGKILEFDLTDLSAGNYFIKVKNNSYNIQKSFIKK